MVKFGSCQERLLCRIIVCFCNHTHNHITKKKKKKKKHHDKNIIVAIEDINIRYKIVGEVSHIYKNHGVIRILCKMYKII